MAVTREQLVGLYLAYFGRPPDYDGYLYYTSQSNLTLTQLEINFSNSPESQAMYGTGSLSQLIDAIYMNLFNRHAEPAGITFWSNAINGGYVTPAGAAYNIMNGAQGTDALAVANKLAVADLWLTHLDTTAEITGYSGDAANTIAREFLQTVGDTAGSLTTATGLVDTEIALAIGASTPGPLTATISSPSVIEGNSGTKQLAFTITLSHESTTSVTINYTTTTGGTATAGDDFDATSGTITFAPGQTVATVNVTVNGDIAIEDDETVVLQVSGNALASNATGTGTILNDDINPLLTTGIDTINVLGTLANTITGVVDADGVVPDNSTFSVGDTINGNGLTVLQLDVASAGAAGAFAFVHDVAAVNVVAGTAGFVSFNAIEWTNIGSVNLTQGVSGLTVHVTALETGVDLSIGSSLGGQVSATYQSGMYADIWNSGKGGASFIDGDVTVHMQDGAAAGAFFSASNDLVLGDVMIDGSANSASAFFGASVFGNADLTVGDVTIYAGDTASVTVAVAASSGNISVGAVGEAAGDNAYVDFVAVGSGDVNVSSIAQVAGTSATASVTISASGDIVVGGIAQALGDTGVAHVTVNGSGDITVGDISQSAGTSSTAEAYVFEHGNGNVVVGNVSQSAGEWVTLTVSTTGSGDVTVGNVHQTAVTSDAWAYFYADEGSITVGDVVQHAGTIATASASLSASVTGTGDITIGNITQTVDGSGNAYVFVYGSSVSGTGGDVSLGNISQTVGDSGYASVSVTADGDGTITVGDVTQSGGSSASARAQFYGSADITVGDVSISVGDGNNNSAYLSITAATGSGATITVGNVDVSAGIDDNANVYIWNRDGNDSIHAGDISVAVGDATTSATRPSGYIGVWNYSASGDVTVGDLSLTLGKTGTGYIDVSQTGQDLMSAGSLTVGDITVNLADKAILTQLYLHNTQTAVTSATAPMGVGAMTIGNIDFNMGTNASASVTITNALWGTSGGTVGDLTVGDITVNADVNAWLSVDILADNTASGDVAGLDVGNIAIDMNDGGAMSLSISAYATTGGHIGHVNVGDVSIVLGVSGVMQELDMVFEAGSIGDVTVGDVSVEVGQYGSVSDGLYLYISASSGDVGNVTVGGVTEVIGQSGLGDTNTISVHAYGSGSIGDVTIGNLNLTVGTSADLNDQFVSISVTATNGDVGNVSVGDINMTGKTGAGEFDGVYITVEGNNIASFSLGDVNVDLAQSATMSDMLYVSVTATGNIGDVTFGNENVTMATSANRTSYDTAYIFASGDIGNVTFGDIVYHLDGSGAYTESGINRTISASGAIGDVSFGDLGMYAVTGAYFSSGMYITVEANTGLGDIAVGDVTLQGTAMSDSMTLEIFVSNSTGDMGNVTLGNWSVQSLSNSYEAYASISVENYGGDMGNFTVGNVAVMAGGSTSASAYAEFFAYANNIGDVTFGDLSVSSTGGAYAEIYATVSATSGSMGDITIGDVSVNVLASSEASITLNFVATGNIGDVTIGDINANVGSAGTSGYYANFDFQANASGDSMGAITVGNVSMGVFNATSGAQVTLNYTAATYTGDVTVGDITMVGASDTAGYAEFVMNFNGGGLTSSNDVTVGTITLNGTTSSTLTVDLYFDTAEVSIGGITVQGSGVFGADYNLNVSGDNIDIGTIAFSVSASAAAYNITDVLVGVTPAGSLNIDTVSYANYALTGASASLTGPLDGTAMTIDVSGYNVANVIGSAYNDYIIVSAIPGSITGGAGKADHFDFSNAVQLDATTVTASDIYTITDFKAGPLFGETIYTGANVFDVAHYAEKSATTLANAITTALTTMSDPTLQSDIVAVQVGGDTYVFVDQDGGNDIDLVVKLAGVSTGALNFADFAS